MIQFKKYMLSVCDLLLFSKLQLLKPINDSIWNACGFERSFNYTKDGEWKPKF